MPKKIRNSINIITLEAFVLKGYEKKLREAGFDIAGNIPRKRCDMSPLKWYIVRELSNEERITIETMWHGRDVVYGKRLRISKIEFRYSYSLKHYKEDFEHKYESIKWNEKTPIS